ncbi:MAG TPA: hypothetical protein VGC34_15075 [Steroidobacteraceae bacterium]
MSAQMDRVTDLAMQPLCGERLLAAWDEAQHDDALQRARTLLAVALPDVERRHLEQMPIAGRNRLLLQLRSLSFGPTLAGFASCPDCGGSLEFSLPIRAVLEQLAEHEPHDRIEWHERDRRLRLRAINTADLLATLDAPDAAAEDLLLARCLTVIDSQVPTPPTAPADSTTARELFERLHAATELRCTLACPHCSNSASLDLDIAHFLWVEVRHAAQQLIGDIHTLASHYGWREIDIARMSAQRRNEYLKLLAGQSFL